MVQMEAVGDTTFRERLARWAREDPQAVYCRFGGRHYTIGEIDRRSSRVANALLARGLKPGDRVALMLPTHPDHVVAIFALMKAALVRVPVNTHAVGPSLAHIFRQFEPHALIADHAYRGALRETLGETLPGLAIWRGTGDEAGFETLLEHPHDSMPDVPLVADDILAFTPSSGTTGPSKGVLKSDRTLRAGPMAILRLSEARPGDVFLFWETLHHGAGVAGLIAAVLGRYTLAMVERFSASRFWDQVRAEEATHVRYLGGVLPMLLKQPPSPRDRDHGVRLAWGGGCPPEVWRRFEERFGIPVREGYGLSELVTFVVMNVEGRVGSIGKPLSWYELRITDEAGNEVPIGETGEIRARALEPGLHFLGYFRNEQAARETMQGEWLCTGDLARRDEDGFLYFQGRKKDMVRRRGINISAWEVEQVVNAHPSVEESALVGVPSELGDEELKIFVRLAPGQELEPLDLAHWCEARMPYYQVPRYVAFIDEFPKTPTQRIRKQDLARSVADAHDLEGLGYVVRRSGPPPG